MQGNCQKTTHRHIFKLQKNKDKGEKKLQDIEKARDGGGETLYLWRNKDKNHKQLLKNYVSKKKME